MTRTLALGALLAAPSAAFVAPRGGAVPSAAALRGATADAAPSPATGRAAAAVVAAAGLGGLAAAASAVSAARRRSRVPRAVVGVVEPLTEKWDPLKLGSTDAKMARYTAVEVKHGRISMIACIGYIMPEIFRFPGCENFENGLGALTTIPFEGWLQLVAFIGAHELFFCKPREGGLGEWDFGFGTELLVGISEEELERRQTVERNNGRLAMVAIMGMMVQDYMYGNPIAALRTDGWWGTSVDYIIKDIPICYGPTFCALKPASRGPGLTAMRATVYRDPLASMKQEREMRMSPSLPFLPFPEQLDGWVGGEKGFDPLGVTDALPVYFVREAELKHGRICMLATIGWIATDCGWRFPAEMYQNVSTLEAHDKMVELGIMQPFLGAIAAYEVFGGYLFLNGFEGLIQRDAGDFFLGKNFLPKDPVKADEMRLKELENGRLAMLAFSGIVTAAGFTGGKWPFM